MSYLLLFEVNIPKSDVFFIYYFRHHTYKKTDHKNVELTEVGPRFEMRCKYGWTKGDFWIFIIIQVFGIPRKYVARPAGPTNAAVMLQEWSRRSRADAFQNESVRGSLSCEAVISALCAGRTTLACLHINLLNFSERLVMFGINMCSDWPNHKWTALDLGSTWVMTCISSDHPWSDLTSKLNIQIKRVRQWQKPVSNVFIKYIFLSLGGFSWLFLTGQLDKMSGNGMRERRRLYMGCTLHQLRYWGAPVRHLISLNEIDISSCIMFAELTRRSK